MWISSSLPGLGGGIGDYWYNRWAKQLATARRVEQADFFAPDKDVWVEVAAKAVEAAERPPLLSAIQRA